MAGCRASPSHNLGLLSAHSCSLTSLQSHGVRRDSGLENAPNVICSYDPPMPESSLEAQIMKLVICGVGNAWVKKARLQQMELPGSPAGW